MSFEDLLRKEEERATQRGLDKLDVLLHGMICSNCGVGFTRVQRFVRTFFDSISVVEINALDAIKSPPRCACPACGHDEPRGDGPVHRVLIYSERLSSHLILTLTLHREAGESGATDARIRVRREITLKRIGEEEEPDIAEDDVRLAAVWQDANLRSIRQVEHPQEAHRRYEALAARFPSDPLVPREFGRALMEEGRTAEAVRQFNLSLRLNDSQPELLWITGRILTGWGNAKEGVRRIAKAWEIAKSDDMLPALLWSAWRAKRLGLVEIAAKQILERDEENLVATRALALLTSVTDPDAAHAAWKETRRLAELAGDRRSESVASYLVDVLTLPIPAWESGRNRREQITITQRELEECGFDACDRAAEAAPATTGGEEQRATPAFMPPDVEVVDPKGRRVCLWYIESVFEPHVIQNIELAIHALRSDPERGDALIGILSREVVPWSLLVTSSGCADARFLQQLAETADPSMTVLDECIDTFIRLARHHFGHELELAIDSLDNVDAILMRMYDDGFGESNWALCCHAAAYTGAVLMALLPGVSWVDGDEGMDPRALRLPDGGTLNLLSKAERALLNGPEDRIAPLILTVLERHLQPAGAA